MKLRSIYLAGGINGLSDEDAIDWREKAKALIPRDIAVLDPMARDYRGKEDESVEDIVLGDLQDIASVDAILAYCPKPSWGTAMEIHHAATTGSPIRVRIPAGEPEFQADTYKTLGHRMIIAVVPAGTSVSPWLRYYTHAVVETLEEAVQWLVDRR